MQFSVAAKLPLVQTPTAHELTMLSELLGAAGLRTRIVLHGADRDELHLRVGVEIDSDPRDNPDSLRPMLHPGQVGSDYVAPRVLDALDVTQIEHEGFRSMLVTYLPPEGGEPEPFDEVDEWWSDGTEEGPSAD